MEINLDSFDFKKAIVELRAVIGRRKLFVLLTCAVTVGVMAAYMHYFPKVYKGSVRVLVEKGRDEARDQFYDRWSVFRGGMEAQTESEMLKVGPVVKEVVQTLNLKYTDVYHPFFHHVIYLWGESWVGKNYRKLKKTIWPPEKTPYDLTEDEIELAKTVEDFRAGITARSETGASVAEIEVLGPTKRVGEMADTLLKVYLKFREDLRRKEAMAAYEALSKQSENAQKRLTDAEETLQDFAVRNDVHFDFDKERRVVIDLAAQENTLLETRANIGAKQGRLEQVRKQLKLVERNEVSAKSHTLNDLRKQLETGVLEQEVKLVQLRERFQPDSPEVRDVEKEIAETKKLIESMDKMVVAREDETTNPVWGDLREDESRLTAELAELRAREEQQVSNIASIKEDMSKLPDRQRQAADITRTLRMAEGEYQVLTEKQREAYISGVTQMADTATLKVVEWSTIPDDPIRPKTKLYYLAAIFVGLLLGVCVALMVDYLDDRLRGRAQVFQAVGKEVYAELRMIPDTARRSDGVERPKRDSV